ncbi:MAG: TonB-dependent receptor [Phormidesmis sp. FL-bin-119]|nr:TonB-dependent receptor [Pedobacter sp.]
MMVGSIGLVRAQVQSGNGVITGTLLDSADSKPISFATATLSDPGTKKTIDGSMANDNGIFTIPNLAPGTYTLTLSFMGYKTKTLTGVTVAGNDSNMMLGTIKLSLSSNVLNEVTVVGQRALIEEKVDRLVYNAENDISNKGGDATDVLRKVPMLSVDLDGNVSMRGSQNIKVLINNRPSTITAGSVADAMKQIPSDMIKSVEVITSPSAKYDAEGSAGIINIITKKNTLQGGFLSLDAAAGLRGSNLGLNGSYKTEKMGFSLGGFGRAVYNTTGSFQNSQITRNTFNDEVLTNQEASTERNNLNGRYTFGWDYDINKNNFISSSVQYGLRNSNIFQNGLLIENFQNNNLLNRSFRNAGVKDNSGTVDVNFNFTHQFNKPQQELSFLALISRNNSTNNFVNAIFNNDQSEIANYLKNINESANKETTVQLDYQNPLGKTQMIEFGGKQILRQVSSDYQSYIANSSNTYSARGGNIFNYDQKVSAGYFSYTLSTPSKYSFKTGLRYEFTSVDAAFVNAVKPAFNLSYGALVPSVNISKKLASGNTLKLAYNRRIQRPSLQFLNPNVQAANPLNITVGNPNLDPEYTNNFELGYSTFIKNSSLGVSAFVRNTNNSIQSVRDLLGADTIRTTFANIGNENAYGMSVYSSINLSNKFTLNGGVDSYYAILDNNVSNTSNQGFVFNIRARGAYKIGDGLSFEAFGFYRGGQVQLQGKQGGFGIYNLNLRKDISQKRGAIGLGAENFFGKSITIRNSINTPVLTQSTTDVQNNLSFRVSFVYRIGKLTNTQTSKKKSVSNDDLKQSGDGGQESGMGAPQGGSQAPAEGQKPKLPILPKTPTPVKN